MSFGKFHPSVRAVGGVCSVNNPSVLVRTINSFLGLDLGGVLVHFAPATATIFNICFGLRDFVFVPIFNLGGKVIPVVTCGCNTSRGRQVGRAVDLSGGCTVTVVFVNTTVFLLVPKALLRLFGTSSRVLRVKVPTLQVVDLYCISTKCGVISNSIFRTFKENNLDL